MNISALVSSDGNNGESSGSSNAGGGAGGSVFLDGNTSCSGTGNITFGLHPLTKDGGAKLIQHNLLYSLLADTNERSILRDWSDLLR